MSQRNLGVNFAKIWMIMVCLFILGFFVHGGGPGAVYAQGHLAVELGHPVYAVIETAELRGVVTRLSSVKPYTNQQVAELLAIMMGRMEAFSPTEQELIRKYAEEFKTGKGLEQSLWKDSSGVSQAGIRIETTTKLDAGSVYDLIDGSSSTALKDIWHFNSRWVPYLKGDPLSWFSFKGEAGFTFDKIERDLYLPYEFTKEWDATHIWFGAPRNSDGTLDYPTASYDIREDIAAETDDSSVIVRLSRFRRDWGIGSGSFSLSDTARPFVGLETVLRPSKYFAISGLVGSLTNWQKSADEKSTAMKFYDENGDGKFDEGKDYYYYSAISYQKMLGLQRMELFPFDWLTISATSSVVGAKRFELGYFSPLLFSVMYQNQLADIDNLAVQVDGQILVPRIGKFYASFYADEMEITNLSELFTKARNMFALQGGAKIPLPFWSFATLTAQYSKIEPFVYSHYPTWYPDYRMQVDTSYTQDGENLGYYLPPNSDEFLVKLDMMPARDWRLSLKYSFVRHGDNPSNKQGDLVIFGDVDKWLEYNWPDGTSKLDDYPDKNFLHDGIYDYNHIGNISVSWRPTVPPLLFGAEIPFELSAGYGISYTWYEDGTGAGRAIPASEWKNVFSMSMKLFL
ncbi:MAG TPA: hypothetical protein PKX66_02600 [Rectinema sp.]|nr:hypothetical protein [Rectinema sp.]